MGIGRPTAETVVSTEERTGAAIAVIAAVRFSSSFDAQAAVTVSALEAAATRFPPEAKTLQFSA